VAVPETEEGDGGGGSGGGGGGEPQLAIEDAGAEKKDKAEKM